MSLPPTTPPERPPYETNDPTLHDVPPVVPGGAPQGPPPTAPPGVGDRPDFHRRFLRDALIAATVLAGLVLLLFGLVFGLGNDWDDLPATTRLAATLAVPITVLGILLVCVGAALAATEWRGTLERQAADGPMGTTGEDLGKAAEGLAKLRGAALLMVVGALLLGGAAWIASSAAEAPASEAPAEEAPVRDGGN